MTQWGHVPWWTLGLGDAGAASPVPKSRLSRRLWLGQGQRVGTEHPRAVSPGKCPGPSMSSSSTGGAKQPQILPQTSCRAGSPPQAGPGSGTSQLWRTSDREGQWGCGRPHFSAPATVLPRGDLPNASTRHGDTAPRDLCGPAHLTPTDPGAVRSRRQRGQEAALSPAWRESTLGLPGDIFGTLKDAATQGSCCSHWPSTVTAPAPGNAVPAAGRAAAGSGH